MKYLGVYKMFNELYRLYDNGDFIVVRIEDNVIFNLNNIIVNNKALEELIEKNLKKFPQANTKLGRLVYGDIEDYE